MKIYKSGFPFRTAFILLLLTAGTFLSAQVPFSKGMNLTQWFEKPSPGNIQLTQFSRQDLIDIKSLGCDVIRLPINLHSMTKGAPDYQIDELSFFLLDQVVDWAKELDIHLRP